MIEPISPNDITSLKNETIPNEVIDAFNDLIVNRWDGKKSVIKQEEVVSILESEYDMNRRDIFNHHYLNVEEIYREKGWKVVFEKPSMGEKFKAYFTFTKGENE